MERPRAGEHSRRWSPLLVVLLLLATLGERSAAQSPGNGSDADVPPLIEVTGQETITVVENQDAEFTFAFASTPTEPLTTTWTHMSLTSITRNLTNSSSRIIFDGNNLTLVDVTTADAGLYNATATNSIGTDSISFILVVWTGPRIVSGPTAVQVNQGTHAIFKCVASGSPPPNITWYDKTGELNPSFFPTVNFNASISSSTLNVTTAQKQGSTTYGCVARNAYGITNQSNASLTVFIPATIAAPPSNISSSMNADVTFACLADGVPTPNISWYKDQSTTPLIAGLKYIFTTDQSNLTVSNLDFSDRGSYYCQASNTLAAGSLGGVESSAPVYLSVLVQPVITAGPMDTTLRNGQSLSLTCVSYGFPNPTVTWQYNGGSLPVRANASQMETVATNATTPASFTSTLALRNVSYYVRGVYNCISTVASFEYSVDATLSNTTNSSATLDVQVQPTFQNSVTRYIDVLENQPFTINCTVFAHPKPTFIWNANPTFTGPMITAVDSPEPFYTSLYTVSMAPVQGTDYIYNITCSANNSVQTNIASTKVTVNVPPRLQPSTGLNVTANDSQNNVELSCSFRGIPTPRILWTRQPNGTVRPMPSFANTTTPFVHSSTLVFGIVNKGDEGWYTCNSTNNQGTDSKQLYLRVQVLPQAVAVKEVNIGVDGRPLTLAFRLSTPGDPAVVASDITWSKVGNSSWNTGLSGYSLSTDRLNLTISSISLYDDGDYIVRIRNAAGVITVSFTITHQEVPIFITKPSMQQVNEQNIATFQCIARGDPLPQITWFVNSTQPISNMTYTYVNYNDTMVAGSQSFGVESVLTIPSAMNNDDQGNYTCVVTNLHGSVNSTATLNVFVPVLVLQQPADVMSSESSNVKFTCSLYGVPAPSITWFKNSATTPLSAGGRISISSSQSELMITNLEFADRGYYYCVGNNVESVNASLGGAVQSSNATLGVFIQPVISAGPMDTTLRNGQSLSLTCVSYGFPNPTVTWQYNGGSLPVGASASQMETVATNATTPASFTSTLALRNVSYYVRGVYNCISTVASFEYSVDATLSNTTNSSATLDVQVQPTFQNSVTRYIDVLENQTFTINCTVFAHPKPTFIWNVNPTFTGPMITPVDSPEPFYTSLYTVSMAPVQGTDYIYNITCSANNSVQTNIASTKVTVNVPPKLQPSTGLNVTANDSQSNVELSCSFRGIPTPRILWTRQPNGTVRPIPSFANTATPFVHSSTLVFGIVDKVDEGWYTCNSTNNRGTDSKQLYLRVQVLPQAVAVEEVNIGVDGRPLTLAFRLSTPGDPAVVASDITWSKVGNSSWNTGLSGYSLSTDRLNLTISSISLYDDGDYIVRIRNAAGVITVSFTITHQEIPIFITQPSKQRVNEGTNVTFQCIARGDPRPRITWFFNSSQLLSNTTYTDVNYNATMVAGSQSSGVESVLTITSATNNAHQGIYTCRVTNVHGSVNSTAILNVFVPVRVLQQPAALMSSESSTVTFTCDLYGVPAPNITWFKNSATTPLSTAGGRISISSNQSELMITNLEFADRGYYYCVGNNVDSVSASLGGAVQSSNATLGVFIQPLIPTALSDVTLIKSATMILTCTSTGFPTPTITWMHNMGSLPARATTGSMTTAATDTKPPSVASTLTVPNVTYAVRGQYTCNSAVSNTGYTLATGQVTMATSSATLTVNVQSEFQHAVHRTLSVLENSTFTISCMVFANPQPTITWASSPSIAPLVTATNSMSMPNYTSSYPVTRAPVQDSTNTYNITCSSQNSVGTSIASTVVTVLVPPEFQTSTSGLNVTVNENQANVELSCSFRGIPTPSILWTRQPSEAVRPTPSFGNTTTPFVHNSTLLFGTVQKSDEGWYTCTSTNSNGTDSKQLYLRVQVLPQATAAQQVHIGVDGRPLSLIVNLNNRGDPNVTVANIIWSKVGNASWIANSGNHMLSASRLNLTFNPIHLNDDGVYTVNITNAAGSIIVTFTITHQEIPIIITAPSRQRINQGGIANFSCIARGDPTPTITWFYNETTEINSALFTNVAYNTSSIVDLQSFGQISTLSIASAMNNADQGRYTCLATNTHGNSTPAEANLEVFIPVIQRTPPTAVNSSEGSSAKFTCDLYGVPTPTISWFKDLSTTALIADSQTSFNTNKSILTISTLTFANRGMYHCEGDNRDSTNTMLGGTVVGSNVELGIFIQPVITTGPINTKLSNGNVLSLTCVSHGFPNPTVTWQYNGGSLPVGANASQVETTVANSASPAYFTSTLTLVSVNYYVRGVYNCISTVASSEYSVDPTLSNTTNSSATLDVEVQPTFQNSVTRYINVLENQTFTINCTVFAHPEPTFTWNANPTFTGPMITPVNSRSEPFYTSLYNVSKAPVQGTDYIYNITCSARNSVQTNIASTQVTVNVVPDFQSSPSGLSVVANENQAMVTLSCIFRGIPKPSIEWSRTPSTGVVRVTPVAAGETRAHTYSSTLGFGANLQKSDEGNYTCNATNANGTDSKMLSLRVQVLPRATAMNASQIGVDGLPLSLVVILSYEGDPAVPVNNITWSKDGNTSWNVNSADHTLSANRLNLTIHRIQHYDDGVYRVIIENAAGSIRVTFVIAHQESPIIVGLPDDVQVNQGLAATFHCAARGDPRPEISWFYNNARLTSGYTVTNFTAPYITASMSFGANSTLTIPSAQNQANQGEYKCQATNTHGTIVATADLTVYVQIQAKAQSASLTGVENMALDLVVNVLNMGFPAVIPGDITWTKVGDSSWSAMATGRGLSTDRRTLNISSVQHTDAGMYTARLVNLYGAITVNFTVAYEEPPVIITPPSDVRVNQDATATFTCLARGDPAPTFSWFYNTTTALTLGVVSTQATITSVMDRGSFATTSTLTLSTVKNGANQGSYKCTASNKHMPAASTSASLRVFVPAIELSAPVAVSSSESATATFSCNLYGVPQPTISWFHGTQPLTSSPRVSITADGASLTISNLEFSDRGNYNCQGDNLDSTDINLGGTVTGQTASLGVYIRPRITTPPVSVTLNEDTTLTLICVSYGFPKPAITWILPAGQTRTPMYREVEANSANTTHPAFYKSTLTLANVNFTDRGDYTCQSFVSKTGYVDGQSLADTVSATATLTVQLMPRFQSISPVREVVYPNGISFSCNYTGNPAPMITFTTPSFTEANVPSHRATAVTTNGTTSGALPYTVLTLTIRETVRQDNGTYTCAASNAVSNTMDSFAIVVLEVPDAPLRPTTTAVAANNINIEWTEPVINNAPVINYTVLYEYTNCNNLFVSNFTTVNKSARTLSLGVEPFQNYSIRVRATNRIGTGNYSLPLMVQALTDRPEATVQNVGIETVSAFTLLVTWDPIPCTERNGRIENYIINCTLQNELEDVITINESATVNVSGSDTQALVGGLDAYSNYSCDVTAFTYVGASPVTGQVSVRTNTSTPLAPQSLGVFATSLNTLVASWSPPVDFNGIPTGYQLNYMAVNSTPDTIFQGFELFNSSNGTIFEGSIVIDNSSITGTDISNLLNFTYYSLTVQAMTSAGLGLESSSVTVQTLENVPGEPLNLTVQSTVGQTWMYIFWEDPPNPYGILTGYQVVLNGISRNDETVTQRYELDVNSSITEFNFTEILSGFDYTVHLRARTSHGFGAEVRTGGRTSAGPPPTVPPATLSNASTSAPNAMTTSSSLVFPVDPLSESAGSIFAYQVYVVHLGLVGQLSIPSQIPDLVYPLGSNNIANYTYVSMEATARTPPTAYVAMEFNRTFFDNNNRRVTIGDNAMTSNEFRQFTNGPLLPLHAYTIFLRGFSDTQSRRRRAILTSAELQKYGLYTSSNFAPIQSTNAATVENSNAGAIAGAIIGVLAAGCLVVLLGYYWRRSQTKTLISDRETGGVWTAEQAETSLTAKKRRSTVRLQRVSTKKMTETAQERGALAVPAFADHVAEMKANDSFLFAKEYEIITKQSPKLAYEVCAKPENKAKNRYANIVAYDETRVMLPVLEDDPHSDYINANFLDGFDHPKEYVACQGPVPEGFADFWRMTWENNVSAIAMLTNLEEKGRLKCHQYWPLSGSVVYGPLTVTLTDTMTLADFIVRTFEIVKKGCSDDEVAKGLHKREVKQFHFTVWPDHGVPDHATPLLNFLRRMRAYHPRDQKPKTPMIIHCSAGVGRTGTLIVIDAMLNSVKGAAQLDVFNYVTQLRTQRNFMVQTEAQYVFLHDALLEALNCGNTEVNAMNLRQYIKDLEETAEGESATNLELQFKRLSAGGTGTMQYRAASAPVNKKKNRLANTLPYDNSRVRLTQLPGVEGSDYINASYVDGFTKAKTFIATQGPMQDTLNDFWTMIWEQEVASVVILSKLRENNSEHSSEYWPKSEETTLTFGKYLVKLESEHTAADIITRAISITNTQENQTRTLHQFQYMAWPERGVPDNGAGVLDLIGQVQRHQRLSGDKPVVVHCSNGVGRTGIFTAICTIIERVKLDSIVDVFQTIKLMRMQRVSMVQNAEQYLFVYRTVLEYLDSFDNYSNFK